MISAALLMTASVLLGQAEGANALPVYSLHALELNEGVEAKQFEAFVADEFAKVFSKATGDVRCLVVKGDRGALKGKYGLVVLFASKAIRDKYFPVEGGEPSAALMEDATPQQVETMKKLGTLVTSIGYTDFILMGK